MNWLRKLFTSEKVLPPIDLGQLRVDLHSHLIPGIDDGAKTMDDSLEMIRGFKALGYQKVITTPHVMSDFYRNSPEIIIAGKKEVKKALAAENIKRRLEEPQNINLKKPLTAKKEKEELLPLEANKELLKLQIFANRQN